MAVLANARVKDTTTIAIDRRGRTVTDGRLINAPSNGSFLTISLVGSEGDVRQRSWRPAPRYATGRIADVEFGVILQACSAAWPCPFLGSRQEQRPGQASTSVRKCCGERGAETTPPFKPSSPTIGTWRAGWLARSFAVTSVRCLR